MNTHDRALNPCIRAIVLDMDGTVWLGDQAVPGAADTVAIIKARGIPLVFLTNISAHTRAELVRRLKRHGIEATEDEVITASWLMTQQILQNHGKDSSVVCVGGGEALRRTLGQAGLVVHDIAEMRKYDDSKSRLIVAVGYTTEFTHEDAKYLVRVSERVIACYATDRDRWFADSSGRSPGVGWIVGAVEGALGHRAISIGKPERHGLIAIADRLSLPVSTILMVGDSVDSDVRAAQNTGCLSCLITTHSALNKVDPQPNFVINSVTQLIPLLRSYAKTLD